MGIPKASIEIFQYIRRGSFWTSVEMWSRWYWWYVYNFFLLLLFFYSDMYVRWLINNKKKTYTYCDRIQYNFEETFFFSFTYKMCMLINLITLNYLLEMEEFRNTLEHFIAFKINEVKICWIASFVCTTCRTNVG